MKMSDYFKGEVTEIHGSYLSEVYFVVNGPHADVELEQDNCEMAVVHAINNHDRLAEENAKLREVLESIVAESEHSWIDLDACIVDAKQLLNQLKDQNNDK